MNEDEDDWFEHDDDSFIITQNSTHGEISDAFLLKTKNLDSDLETLTNTQTKVKNSCSPTPSSNASIMASEEDEGFDDLEFPKDIQNLQIKSIACEDDMSSALIIPDSLEWNKDTLEQRIEEVRKNFSSRIPIPVAKIQAHYESHHTKSKDTSFKIITPKFQYHENRRVFQSNAGIGRRQETRHNFSQSKPPKQKKTVVPTLIRNINPSDMTQVIGSMRYDPILQKWTGNEEDELQFDFTNAKPRVKPELIPNDSSIPKEYGNMVFDGIKMCWIGNEEESEIFEGIECEETPSSFGKDFNGRLQVFYTNKHDEAEFIHE